MYAIYEAQDVSAYEGDDVDEFIDLHEAEEIIRQIRETDPELYARITDLRDGIRCGHAAGRRGTFVFCRAGEYRQLYLLDEQGEIVTRDAPRILGWLKCDPETPAEELPEGYNQRVMTVKRQFESEVQARKAEREHTVSLTRAQRYVRRELRLLFSETDDEDLRRQIEVLERTFTQAGPRPAVRSELNRIQREQIAGTALVDTLSNIYNLYGLDADTPAVETTTDDNHGLPRIVCSEALFD